MPSNRNRRSQLKYENLEQRNLLATVVGTPANDIVTIEYVDAITVNITINGERQENVDVSDRLHVDLREGSGDMLTIDHRVEAETLVFNTETLTLDGGDNNWQIGSFANPDESNYLMPAITAGSVNGNIRFAGVETIRSGAGFDQFNVNTNREYALSIFAGEGDDLFRFSKSQPIKGGISGGDLVEPLHVKGFGEGGNDRFVIRDLSNDRAYGGTGFDIVDYRMMDHAVSLNVGDVMRAETGNDRIFGKLESQNTITAGFERTDLGNLDWVISGQWTTVSERNGDHQVELMNFSQFQAHAQTGRFDRAWVLTTATDLRLIDMTWTFIGSTQNRATASLDTINHDITILKTTGDDILAGSVEFNNEAGNSTNAVFGSDGVIHGLTNAEVRFSDGPLGENSTLLPYLRINGSGLTDFFRLDRVWAETSIHGNGGDDTFRIGGRHEDPAADLTGITSNLRIYGGGGLDRVYVNDLAGTAEVDYKIGDNFIADGNDIPAFHAIGFDGLEVVRITASAHTQNDFEVTPSATTIFAVDSSANSDSIDTLEIIGQRDVRQLSNDNGTGSWGFAGERKRVYFYGVEDPGQNDPANILPSSQFSPVSLPTRQHVYSNLDSAIISSQTELDHLIDTVELASSDSANVVQALQELEIDFAFKNFLFYTHTETSGSIGVELGRPIDDVNQVLIEIDRSVPELGTADMAYYAYAFEVDKAFERFEFTDGKLRSKIIERDSGKS